MNEDIKKSHDFIFHIQNMSAYKQGAEEKGVSLRQFLSENVGLNDDLVDALITNWVPGREKEFSEEELLKNAHIEEYKGNKYKGTSKNSYF